MNCNEIEQHLADYLGGELAPSAVETFDAHLKVCDTCRREVESLGGTLDALHRLPAPPVEMPIHAPWRASRPQPLAYAATLLIGLGVGWWIRPVIVAPPGTRSHLVADHHESAPAGAPRALADAVLATYTGRDGSSPFTRNTVRLVRALSTSPRY